MKSKTISHGTGADKPCIRLGLCCLFVRAPIRFRTTTAAALLRMPRKSALLKLSGLIRHNAESLAAAVQYCAANGIGAFRVNSGILPVKTHPRAGYTLAQLPEAEALLAGLEAAGRLAKHNGIRLSLHPDQFVLLGSEDEAITRSSLDELESQAELAEIIGADVVNIHAGGGYGDKAAALSRLVRRLDMLSGRARSRLTIENDDRVFTPSDLIPFCKCAGIPFVYDVHHHRCLPDGLTIEQAATMAVSTWNREPVFHISSPRNGWNGPHPERHHDYISARDVPRSCPRLRITLDVEAKAKELAVKRLRLLLARRAG